MFAVRVLAIISIAASLTACTTTYAASPDPQSADKSSVDAHDSADHSADEPRPYETDVDARTDVDDALEAAQLEGKMTIVAMGANWCHDSRGLAAQFEKKRFQTLLSEHYELVYVDVGEKDRNIDIAQSFGVDKIAGTPTVFVISSAGDVLNLDTAPTWRNAASRSEDEVFEYFEEFVRGSAED